MCTKEKVIFSNNYRASVQGSLLSFVPWHKDFFSTAKHIVSKRNDVERQNIRYKEHPEVAQVCNHCKIQTEQKCVFRKLTDFINICLIYDQPYNTLKSFKDLSQAFIINRSLHSASSLSSVCIELLITENEWFADVYRTECYS